MSRGKNAEKKKPARVAAGPEAPGFARSLGENTGRLISPVLPLLVFFAVGGGLSFLLWRSTASAEVRSGAPGRAGERLTDRMIRGAILQTPRPFWISKEDFERTANLGLFALDRSIFEANLSRTLAERYESSPWVERVNAVRLRYPAQMEVEIEWRKPAARVDRLMVLDRMGYVLNLMGDSQAVRDIPVITGLIATRSEAGTKVREKELIEALELLAVVKDALGCSPGQLKVSTILREPSGMWRVITDRGPAIYWGAFTDDPPMDEPRTREKAELLRRRLCEIKDPALLEYIKVYHATAPVKPRAAVTNDVGRPAVTQTASTSRARR